MNEREMRASEIRPEHTKRGQLDAQAADVAWLLERRDAYVEVACPACESRQATLEFVRKGLSYWRCSDCGAVYTNPRPTAKTLSEFYAQSSVYRYWSSNVYEATAENRRRLLFRPRAELLVERCRAAGFSGGTMVEVGSSQGLFCDEVRRLGLFDRIAGIELTPDQAQASRALGIETYEMSFEETTFDFKANAIASFETIEHLFSPKAFLDWSWENLSPGGYLMLTCPNIAGFEAVVLGPESGIVDHEHLNYFTPDSFRILAKRAGFEDVEISTPGRLDVEIVQDALAEGRVSAAALGRFITAIVTDTRPQTAALFQSFLQQAGLSSNMMVLARKGTR